MKKLKQILWIVPLVVMFMVNVGLGQGSETFTNSNLTASYADGNFTGDNSVVWTYVQSRDESSYGITGKGIMLRYNTGNSKVTSSSVSGGIGNFTCSLRKAFSGAGNRQVELFINGVSKGSSIAWDNTTVQTFTVNNINVAGSITIEIRDITAYQVIVDDISWTGYTPNDQTSIVGAPSTQISASNIASTSTSSGSAVNVFNFKISDLGNTGDGLATKVTQVKIKKSSGTATWSSTIGGAELWYGAIQISTGTVAITDNDITFPITSGNLDVPNHSNKEITLKIWLKTTGLIDNSTMVFTVSQTTHGFTADASGSGFATDFGAAVTGNTMTLRVESTKLNFVQQPTNTNLNATMNPAVTIEATDANNNRDLDKTGSVTLVSTGSMTGPVTATLTNGFGAFSNIVHTAVGTSLSLTASLSGLSDATSNTFNISIITPGLLLSEENFASTNGVLTANGWSQISTISTNPITTGNGNGLSFTNYGSSGIGNGSVMTTSGQDVFKTFTAQNPGAGSSTIYYSCLVNISSVQTGDYFIALGEASTLPTGTSQTYRGRLYVKQGSSLSKMVFGIATASGTVNYGSTEYNTGTGTPILLVVKHVFTTTTSTSNLYINPSLFSEPPSPDASDNTASTVAAGLDAIVLRQGGSGSSAALIIDGIRVGTNWGAVLGNPSYSSADNINAGNYNNVSVLSGDLTLTGTGDVNVNGILTLTSGNITTGTNSLILGTGTATTGTLNWTSGMIIGGFTRWFNSGTTVSRLFPIGTGTDSKQVEIQTNTITTGGTIKAEYVTGDPGNSNLTALTDAGSYTIDAYSKTGKWVVTGNGLDLTGGSYDIKITAENIVGVSTPPELRLVKRPSAGNLWTLEGYHSTGDGTIAKPRASRTGLTGFSEFAIAGNSAVNTLDGLLPVELSSFTSNVISRDVKLNWTTASENNNAGFEIQKSEVSSQEAGKWVKVGYVTGNGTKTTPTNYSFDDRKLNTGKYKYRLKQIDFNGNFEYFNLAGEVEIGVPKKYDISQNYPNPFNPTAKIDFDLPYDSKVSMKLYDISGREVMTLVNEQKSAGYYTVQMNGNNLSSGMYFYRIIAEGNGQNFVMTKKAVLIK
ncbi:MAG TPA: T9SS type A sorting domain-containing protein [Ignavibacteria bacterium]